MKLQILFFVVFTIFSRIIVFANDDVDVKYAKDLLQPGEQAPAIMVEKDGNSISLLEINKGKYIVLEFWASWCGDCRADMKYMRSINRTFCCDSIMIQGYSFDRDETSYNKCRKDSALAWSNVLSPKPMRDSEVRNDYHVGWIPCYYIIGKDGKIILSTVMVEKVQAKLREIAPEAKEDDMPLNSLTVLRAENLNYISKKLYNYIEYPEVCQKKRVTGRVFMSFVVTADGEVSDVVADKVTVDNCHDDNKLFYAKQFGSAAVKAIRSIKKADWKIANDKGVKIKLNLPVTFRL